MIAKPTATQKATGRRILASTLHFHQLVTDDHLLIGDELHVPLTAVIRPDGSKQPLSNVIAVMVVWVPFLFLSQIHIHLPTYGYTDLCLLINSLSINYEIQG